LIQRWRKTTESVEHARLVTLFEFNISPSHELIAITSIHVATKCTRTASVVAGQAPSEDMLLRHFD
jgi:hypothetical protein